MRILGISGSLRRDSYNTSLLRAAGEVLPAGVELETWEGLKGVPPYDQDDDTAEAPAAVAELRSAVADADAVLIATPEYNASIPGHLKNALDWVSRPVATNPLRHKPAAVIGASTGAFGALVPVLALAGGSVFLGEEVDALKVAGVVLVAAGVFMASGILSRIAPRRPAAPVMRAPHPAAPPDPACADRH